jgi:hypothetical protein
LLLSFYFSPFNKNYFFLLVFGEALPFFVPEVFFTDFPFGSVYFILLLLYSFEH